MYISVKIIKGKGRGKSILGYATANALTRDNRLTGREGAWYATINYNGGIFNSVCGVSKKGSDYVLETHILDFSGDLYDKNIYISFIYHIRGSIIFKGLDESKAQLEKDIDVVKN